VFKYRFKIAFSFVTDSPENEPWFSILRTCHL
jgi:hypothetical protein